MLQVLQYIRDLYLLVVQIIAMACLEVATGRISNFVPGYFPVARVIPEQDHMMGQTDDRISNVPAGNVNGSPVLTQGI